MNTTSILVALTLVSLATIRTSHGNERTDESVSIAASTAPLAVYVLQRQGAAPEQALEQLRWIAGGRPLRLVCVPADGLAEPAAYRPNSAPHEESMLFGSDAQALVVLRSLLRDPSAFTHYVVASPASTADLDGLFEALARFGNESADLTLLVSRSDAAESLALADVLDSRFMARPRPRLTYRYAMKGFDTSALH